MIVQIELALQFKTKALGFVPYRLSFFLKVQEMWTSQSATRSPISRCVVFPYIKKYKISLTRETIIETLKYFNRCYREVLWTS